MDRNPNPANLDVHQRVPNEKSYPSMKRGQSSARDPPDSFECEDPRGTEMMVRMKLHDECPHDDAANGRVSFCRLGGGGGKTHKMKMVVFFSVFFPKLPNKQGYPPGS